MTIDEFCALHPRLYHMATANSLPQIETYGLLSTERILALLNIAEEDRVRLTTQRRAQMTPLNHPELGSFTLRDQKPMRDAALATCLDGMTIAEWYKTLNERVFMWASRERVDSLLSARAYKKQDQLVLTIDPRSLLTAHFDAVSVSTINSGATLYTPVRRGTQTFIRLKDFPTGKGTRKIVEVTVDGGVPEMRRYIMSSEIRKAEK
jgi:hypothetical protein